MDVELLRKYCLSKKGCSESFPFDEDTLVFKVMGKMFALIPLENPVSINLKCDPEYALELRERYFRIVLPGYHMNKKHWNTVMINGGLENSLIQSFVDHSYNLVVAKLKKADREALRKMPEH